MKNDAIAKDYLRYIVGGLSVHFCTIIIGILKIVPKDLKKKYFRRSFRNLITTNFDFVPTGAKLCFKFHFTECIDLFLLLSSKFS